LGCRLPGANSGSARLSPAVPRPEYYSRGRTTTGPQSPDRRYGTEYSVERSVDLPQPETESRDSPAIVAKRARFHYRSCPVLYDLHDKTRAEAGDPHP